MADYYDKVLATIPLAIAIGAVASVHEAVAVYEGVGAGSLLATLLLFEVLFRNPPTEPRRSGTIATVTVGVGWAVAFASLL